ncbi:hypothetical protein ABS71_02640 [bacterium SCN 62-11]|nr:hypothetical protein [Candidatus Eremiobacteraeota bacterium]ODT77280.1 MAG: hypothetical protein ABS71_02640 [bacterium SCN 62-11]
MRNLLFVLLLSLPALALPSAEEVVTKLYRTHLKTQDMRKTVAQNGRCFTPEFLELLEKALSKPEANIDIFTHRKESMSDFELGPTTIQGNQAQVHVEIWTGGRVGLQKGEPEKATLYLITVNDGVGLQVNDIQFTTTRPRFKVADFLRGL